MQDKVSAFIREFGLETDIQSRFIDFVAETGELGKAVLMSTDYGMRKAVITDELLEEAGDTLFALLALFSDLSLNEEEVLEDVLKRYRSRMEQLRKP
ncbi:MAG: MazG-like family protein [Solobacterium sp.]|nr:MazG-like family protein [Solobacterium sp.]MBR2793968.1 MazG-like family protein [Solobacterium sp.]